MAQTMGTLNQVMRELSQPDVDRSTGVQVMRELAHRVMRAAEGLIAFSHLAEALILSQPRLPSPAPAREEAGRIAPVGEEAGAEPTPQADEPEVPALQVWREASDAEFVSHLKAWMEAADVDQDDLCRVLGYKPVYIRRIMRGTDPITNRFRERLLDYAASREKG